MNLLYIAYGNVSVFDSQVISLLNYYIETKSVKEVILMLGVDYKDKLNSPKTKKLNKEIKVIFYKHYPQYMLIENFTINSIANALKKINNIDKYIIHVRNDVLAHYVFKASSKIGILPQKIIADVRGAGFEQLTEFSNKNKIVLELKRIQRKQTDNSLIKIKNISVVSNSLKQYLNDKIGDNLNIIINSCLANNNFVFNKEVRKITREELNVRPQEHLLVLSTGGDNAWQNTQETVNTLANKGFKILNLSRSVIDHKNVITKFVPYNEMYKYLCAADAAIIWRNKAVTNKVASPVKFSEYICCGLPVLTNDSIDLITNYIKEYSCGKILQSMEAIDDSLVNTLRRLDRFVLAEQGRSDFGIEAIAHQYKEFYQYVLKINS